ncbi:MAG: HDOD domain-containing protein [Dehalococcoidia bacterium]|nr:HDOD domain-containing protein [Dehalococcoidia bacterium]
MPLPTPPDLPILPTPRERALLILMNPDASIEGFTAVVEGDPSLTAAVLRAANSAMSWPSHPIRSASEGVVRLGSVAVKHLITTSLIRSQFSTIEAAGIDADELWRHLLGCALLCEVQAGDDESAAQTAFTAGLLHDLGRLAMAAQAPTRYRQVVRAAQEGVDARVAERDLFGIDHAEFGQQICERWSLPDEVTEATGGHHEAGHGVNEEVSILAPSLPAEGLTLARSIISGLGIGDGVRRPDKRDDAAENHPLIVGLGGRVEFMDAIRWFRESTHGRHRNVA